MQDQRPQRVYIALLGSHISPRAVLQCGEILEVPAQLIRHLDKLAYTSPHGLAYSLLDVVPLPFGSVRGKHRELMQLDTIGKGLVTLNSASLVFLPVWTSPRVTLVHLFDDAIPLGLWVPASKLRMTS